MIRPPLIPIKIVSQEEAETASFLVCVSVAELPEGKPYFADDVYAACAHCGTAIVHRPHAPASPTKICPACAADHMQGGHA